jgi:hypothetical protein
MEGNGVKPLLRAVLAAVTVSLVAAGMLLGIGPAAAASLTRVTAFGTNPTNLNMYLYVPDTVAARPALLVMVHYCTGSASGVFNGVGHDYVTAADRSARAPRSPTLRSRASLGPGTAGPEPKPPSRGSASRATATPCR